MSGCAVAMHCNVECVSTIDLSNLMYDSLEIGQSGNSRFT